MIAAEFMFRDGTSAVFHWVKPRALVQFLRNDRTPIRIIGVLRISEVAE